MKSRFRIYTDILQLRTPAFVALKYANGGMRYTVSMFFVVSLIAGAGLWVGLPALMQKPLLVEQLDEVSAFIDRVDAEVAPEINASLDALSREKSQRRVGRSTAPRGRGHRRKDECVCPTDGSECRPTRGHTHR